MAFPFSGLSSKIVLHWTAYFEERNNAWGNAEKHSLMVAAFST
jgi:hypothetical protein